MEIVWRAFELRPDPVPTLDPKGEYLRNAWRNGVYPLAAKLAIPIKLPPLQPRSRLAHEAAHWARSQGRFDDYQGEVFRAFFERGEDIGDIDFLISLAAKLELDAESLRQALADHAFLPTVIQDEQQAQLLGISGVPAFIAARRFALNGVHPIENLSKLVSHVRSQTSTKETPLLN